MINRINLILQAKNITAKQFADEIGIQPSGMSHILGGRNNPSLEFVSKVIRRYPEIDANWLLLGKGEMYGEYRMMHPEGEPTLFSMEAPSPAPDDTRVSDAIPEIEHHTPAQELLVDQEPKSETAPQQEVEYGTDVESEPASSPQKETAPIVSDGRRLVKILFFYDDYTFSEYRPE
mgnify:CR=1 FL=1